MDIHVAVTRVTQLFSVVMSSGSENQKIVALQSVGSIILPDFPGTVQDRIYKKSCSPMIRLGCTIPWTEVT